MFRAMFIHRTFSHLGVSNTCGFHTIVAEVLAVPAGPSEHLLSRETHEKPSLTLFMKTENHPLTRHTPVAKPVFHC